MTDEAGAAEQLAHAHTLGARTRRDTRWYGRYLVVFGLGSLAVGAVYASTDGVAATAIAMPLWIAVVAALSWYAATRRTTMRGFGRLHGTVIAVWSAIWLVTVLVGSQGPMGGSWWLGGGMLMAATAFTGALVARRRSRA